MKIIRFETGDTLRLKKAHPCGAFEFTVMRVGSEVRIKCKGCEHDVTVERVKLEKNIRAVNGSPV